MKEKKKKEMTRRKFISHSAVTGTCLVIPGYITAAEKKKDKKKKKKKGGGYVPPKRKLNIAGIGLGVRGLGNMEKCKDQNIIALCDPDWISTADAFRRFPDTPKYKDYRKMLDKEKDIEAVVISTPDHTHAVIAAEAMKRGKHVFVEMPLAHSVWEARELARIAQEKGVITQMGNERHSGAGIRNAVEMIWGGGLGQIKEAHCWTNRPQWPQGMNYQKKKVKVPTGLDWNLWLGPASERDYDPAYHPFRWRGWLDFGTGAIGAMGCHVMDCAFWGLKLGEAKTIKVEAESTGISSGTFPKSSTIRFQFPARGKMAPVMLTWHDGGRQPSRPKGLPYQRELGSNGSVFYGEKLPMMFGAAVSGTTPSQVGPRTIPEFTPVENNRKAYTKIPRVPETDWKKGDRHIKEWISCCVSGKQPCSNFSYSGPLTEMLLLGNAALIARKPIEWERESMKITGISNDNPFIRREYRKGWSL